jgi:hypothetical protein
MQEAANKYGNTINSAINISVSAWRFSSRSKESFAELWVDKTNTHYRYPTIEGLLEAVRIKTLLHRKFQ